MAERPGAMVRRLLVAAIREPGSLVQLSAPELDMTLRLARRVRLLARLASKLAENGLLDSLPEEAATQLESAAIGAEARDRMTRWELDRIAWVLSRSAPDTPVAVLKGCAYMLAGLPNAAGRLFADVDLLVAERELELVERALLAHGWEATKLSQYDQHYYRAWTHELPPMMHVEREVELDLHHNILPRTGRLHPRADLLLAALVPIAGQPFSRLQDVDVVLHAMTHLMFDSELADALRDLVDIDDLLRHFSTEPDFWSRLLDRAVALNLERPTYYALRFAWRLLGTPVPNEVLRHSRCGAPPALTVWLMDWLVPQALFPRHPDHPSPGAGLARWWLYVRSLWIRMPLPLLVRHLSIKFYTRHMARTSR